MRTTRRAFVRQVGVVAGGALLLGSGERSYRACVIGSTGRGNYGHGLDVTFQRIPRVRLVGLADPDEAGRETALRRTGAERGYRDWREMLRTERPDLVSIGPRWVRDRLEMITAAADVGAHVYMEKPMAASLEEADAILEVADRRGIRIVIAHQVRQAPAVEYVKRRIEDGLIGDLLEVRTRGKEDHRAGGEDLMVLGTHCMYLMRYFAGAPLACAARVTQEGRDVVPSDRREATEPLGPVAGDTVHAAYAFEGGVQGYFASQKVGPGLGGRFQLVLQGSKGIVAFPIDQDPQVYHLDDRLWLPPHTGVRWKRLEGAPDNRDASTGLQGQFAANKRVVESLLRWIETGEESPVSGREGRSALEMILAVYAAHLSRRWVSLPLKSREHPLLS